MHRVVIFLLSLLIGIHLNIYPLYAYNDITSEYTWAKEALETLHALGAISGDGDNHFSPEKIITRAELSKMLALTFGAPIIVPTTPTFSDVKATHWAYAYVESCKEIFTGIQNPLGDKPLFLPDAFVTREDFACFLILSDGLVPEKENFSTILSRYSDAFDISPNLKPYLAKAIKKEYLLGFTDRTIKPQRPVTRAEAVVMLFRALKKGGDSLQRPISLQAEVTKGKSSGQFIFQITCEEISSLTINTQSIPLKCKKEDDWAGSYMVELQTEGNYPFELVAKKGFRTLTLHKNINYQISAPTLMVLDLPFESYTRMVRIRGNVKDEYDQNPKVWVNSQNVSFGFNGDWSYVFPILEGDNEILIKAVNRFGRATEQKHMITGLSSTPTIQWINCPKTTDIQTITLSGYMNTKDTKISLLINQNACSLKPDNSFSYKIKLKSGENRIVVRAVNSFGRECTELLKIHYNAS